MNNYLIDNDLQVEPPVAAPTDKPELTCISEEGIADMDLPDNLLDDLDYIGDCITSCNKVTNFLFLPFDEFLTKGQNHMLFLGLIIY